MTYLFVGGIVLVALGLFFMPHSELDHLLHEEMETWGAWMLFIGVGIIVFVIWYTHGGIFNPSQW